MNFTGAKKPYLAKGKTCWLTFWCFLLLLVTPGPGLAFLPGLEDLIDDQSGEEATATDDDGQADSAPQGNFTPPGLEVAKLVIPKEMVDGYFPTRATKSTPSRLLRAAQPFGPGSDWFAASTIAPRQGGLRITDAEIDGTRYWLDMLINLYRPELPLEIVDFGEGEPQRTFPSWSLGSEEIDFRMARADIIGPPPAFTLYDVGAGGYSYNLEFALSGNDFAFSRISPGGYIHYYPNADDPQLGIVTDSPQAPSLVGGDSLCFDDLKPSTPMTLFNVDGATGQDYLNIKYCQGARTQMFTVTDGMARGRYSPPGAMAPLLSRENPGVGDSTFYRLAASPGWFSRPTRAQQLDQCIEDQTAIRVGLQRSNKLGESLVGVATAFGGAIKLSDKTLNAAKDALLSSQSVIADALATGRLDGAKMSEFVLKTILKNATPKEHKAFVDKFFGDNIPEHVQNAANTAGSTMEGQYKMALLGVTQGLTETFFPVASSMAKSVVEARKWAVEAMADEDIRHLYNLYREVNGRWDDFSSERVTRFRPNQSMRIGQILRNRGESDTPAKRDEYLNELFADWYQQESDAPQIREELNAIRERYDNDFTMRSQLEDLTPGWSECERLQRLLDWYNMAQLEIQEAMGDCRSYGRPPVAQISQIAINMVQDRLRPGTTQQRRDAWQQTKLDFLRDWDCLNYEEREEGPPGDDLPPGQWSVAGSTDYTFYDRTKTMQYSISGAYITSVESDEAWHGSRLTVKGYVRPGDVVSVSVAGNGVKMESFYNVDSPPLAVVRINQRGQEEVRVENEFAVGGSGSASASFLAGDGGNVSITGYTTSRWYNTNGSFSRSVIISGTLQLLEE